MSVIARGSKQVADFQRALGGNPSKSSLLASRAALSRYMAERHKAMAAAREEASRLAHPLHELAFSHIDKNDPKLRKSIQANKRAFEQRSKSKLKPPARAKFEAEVRIGSIQAVRVPPYDSDWAAPDTASRVQSQADKSSGTYHLQQGSLGDGWLWVGAGIACSFPAPVDDPQQRVAALIDYSDFWMDDAFGYTAQVNFNTHIWVWGDAAGDWVMKADVAPQWSDGVGWFESHGNGDGEDARISVETRFPAFAGTWYTAWIWSEAAVYANGGFLGTADSFVHFEASVPLIVFGSL